MINCTFSIYCVKKMCCPVFYRTQKITKAQHKLHITMYGKNNKKYTGFKMFTRSAHKKG